MIADPNIVKELLAPLRSALGTAQIQSALIAAIVSFIVAWLATRRDRRARRVLRAERLLRDIYNPIETSLNGKSLHSYLLPNRDFLRRNRHDFRKDIGLLIDQALSDFHSASGIGFAATQEGIAKEQESARKLQEIQDRLIPLLKDEIKRLKAIVAKESG